MQIIFTIGTQGRHDDDFVALLKQRQIDAVIDIRLHNEGRYYRFASGEPLHRGSWSQLTQLVLGDDKRR